MRVELLFIYLFIYSFSHVIHLIGVSCECGVVVALLFVCCLPPRCLMYLINFRTNDKRAMYVNLFAYYVHVLNVLFRFLNAPACRSWPTC